LPDERLSDIGEFGLIREIARISGRASAIAGIGDDAAVLDMPGGQVTLATVDMLVEDVHFRLSYMSPEEIGATALAVSISDIAAMGGTPLYALVSLAASPQTPVDAIRRLVSGLVSEGKRFGVSLVGGNVAGTEGPLTIDVVMIGSVMRDEVVLRSGALPGDVIAVTGKLGARAAFRMSHQTGLEPAPSFQVPVPRVEIGRALSSRHLAHAMIDLSDGLAGDIKHVCEASGVGAVLFEALLPVADEARSIASALGTSPVDLALGGGEDYELLICLDPADLEAARSIAGDVGLTAVGRVLAASSGVLLEDASGRRKPLTSEGWEHF
jgi:thiamine-monophosphate kinase